MRWPDRGSCRFNKLNKRGRQGGIQLDTVGQGIGYRSIEISDGCRGNRAGGAAVSALQLIGLQESVQVLDIDAEATGGCRVVLAVLRQGCSKNGDLCLPNQGVISRV